MHLRFFAALHFKSVILLIGIFVVLAECTTQKCRGETTNTTYIYH